MKRFLALALIVGCGDDGGSTKPDDAAIDAPADAAIDAPLIDAPAPPMGVYHFVIDRLRVPANNNEARMYGLDLDADQVVDNQLGMVMATLAAQGFDVQAETTRAIDRGRILSLLRLAALDFTADLTATAALFKGTASVPEACLGPSDTVCRRHLTGNGTFTVAATPVNPALTGGFSGGVFNGGPGQLSIGFLFPFASTATDVTLIGARIRIGAATATSLSDVIIAGAVSETEIDTKVIPDMQAGIMASVAMDCTMLSSPPQCGCASGSTGRTLLNLFDANTDCAVSVQEVRDNSLIQSLLAPDVSINGTPSLSVGFGASAVRGGYVTP